LAIDSAGDVCVATLEHRASVAGARLNTLNI
jgi:hypothetical protein